MVGDFSIIKQIVLWLHLILGVTQEEIGQKWHSGMLLLAMKVPRCVSCCITPTNNHSMTKEIWSLKHPQTICAVVAPWSCPSQVFILFYIVSAIIINLIIKLSV